MFISYINAKISIKYLKQLNILTAFQIFVVLFQLWLLSQSSSYFQELTTGYMYTILSFKEQNPLWEES